MSKKGKGAGETAGVLEEERQDTEGGGHLAVSGGTPLETLRSVTNESGAEGGRVDGAGDANVKESTASSATRTVTAETDNKPPVTEYANGYQPPPKLPWTTSTALALKAYGKWVLTIPGFLITVYVRSRSVPMLETNPS